MAEEKEIQQIIEQEIRESEKPRKSSRKRKEKKPKNKFKFIAFVEMLLIIVLSGELAWNVFLRDRFTDDKTVPASTDADSLEPQVRRRPVIEKEETIYQFNGKKILMKDGVYGEIFFPVFADVPACQLDMENLVTRNGYSFYTENGRITSIPGIDVSEHQREVDWRRVKADGIDFAVIRLGYRGYSEGGIYIDPFFEANLTGAKDAGVLTGIYFFSQAITPEEAKEEARKVIDTLAGRQLDLPVYYDWETIDNSEARTNGLDGLTLTQCAIAFCEEIKNAGYTPGIYTNRHIGYFVYRLDQIDDYEFWLSTDGAYPDFYYRHNMWQYSFAGKVDGVNGNVDLNMRLVENEPAQ